MRHSMNHALLVSAVAASFARARASRSARRTRANDARAGYRAGLARRSASTRSRCQIPTSPSTASTATWRNKSSLRNCTLLFGDKSDDRVFADFRSYNLGQNNQMYNLHAGVYGLLDIQMQYLDIPHYLSDDVGSIAFTQNGGNFTPELASGASYPRPAARERTSAPG